jgi:hypothetical protein
MFEVSHKICFFFIVHSFPLLLACACAMLQAYVGYDGLVPISIFDLSFSSLWLLTGYRMPKQVHVRIKRYSMEVCIAGLMVLSLLVPLKTLLFSLCASHDVLYKHIITILFFLFIL